MHKERKFFLCRALSLIFTLTLLWSVATASTVEFVVDDATAMQYAAQSVAEDIPLASTADGATYDGLPWNLVLVNADHAIPPDWVIPAFTELKGNQKVDSRIYPELQRMFDDCRKAGIKPMVKTSYRTYEDQKNMLVRKYKSYRNQGKSDAEAKKAALKVAAMPDHSEHQLGLAVDIDSANTKTCSNDKVWSWMKKNCHKYGFIWRYPGEKTEITGISNEQWHFRYVGVEAATYIMENGLCLEEYLEQVYGYK